MMSIMLVSSFTFTACSEDDLATDQYGNEIKLNSFGPCPVLRGGTLRFLGSNLDQIEQVLLPGADPITAIDVKQAGKISEIWIEVPKEKCEPGIITLITAKGGEIKTVSEISYEENIVINKCYVGTEGNLDGNVGDIVTFKGDYLNLMHAVVFADNARVTEDEFVAHDRYTISVAIPKEAKSGRPMLSNNDPENESLLAATEAINVGLPSASGIAPAKLKAGETITVSGTSLNLIETISLNGAEVAEDAITRAADGKSLSFVLPIKAADGEVTLYTYSGIAIPAGSIETVVPTELSSAPAPVKNGETITISGKDLDLVTSVMFNNVDAAVEFQYADGKITAVVPEAAQTGKMTLGLENGKTVTVDYTLVDPTVVSCSPAELMAGEKVMIKGTDLDLVAKVAFPGDVDQVVDAADFTAQNANAIALTVPSAAFGSGLKLILKNGAEVKADASVLTIKPATDPAISEAPEKMTVGKTVTIKGKNFNNVESILLGSTKVVKITNHTNSELTFVVPNDAPLGACDITLVTPEGNKIVAGKTTIMPAELVCWEGTFDEGNWTNWEVGKGTHGDSNPSMFLQNGIKAGSTIYVYVTPKSDWWQIQFFDGHWGGFAEIGEASGANNGNNINPNVYQLDDQKRIKITVTAAMVDKFQYTDWGCAWIIQCENLVVNKITLIP